MGREPALSAAAAPVTVAAAAPSAFAALVGRRPPHSPLWWLTGGVGRVKEWRGERCGRCGRREMAAGLCMAAGGAVGGAVGGRAAGWIVVGSVIGGAVGGGDGGDGGDGVAAYGGGGDDATAAAA